MGNRPNFVLPRLVWDDSVAPELPSPEPSPAIDDEALDAYKTSCRTFSASPGSGTR